jgi:hypothetical protein
MQYIDGIIKIASLLGALGVIIAFFIKINTFIKEAKKAFEHNEENYMAILRLTIMSTEMPIGERINAGYKYLEKGGNGEVKKFLNNEFNITDTIDTASHYKK